MFARHRLGSAHVFRVSECFASDLVPLGFQNKTYSGCIQPTSSLLFASQRLAWPVFFAKAKIINTLRKTGLSSANYQTGKGETDPANASNV